MEPDKIRLQDVADRAGVSRAAVSLALGNHPKARSFRINTVERIRQVARDMGYRPNFFGSQLRRDTAQVLMVYVDSIQDLYTSAIAESFVRQATRRGYWTMVAASSGRQAEPAIDEKIIGAHGISAVALVSTMADGVAKRDLRRMRREDVKVVAVGRHLEGESISSVLVDDRCGGQLAAEHVYGLGARSVWLMTRAPGANPSRQTRFQAVLDYAGRHGMPPPAVLNLPSPNHAAGRLPVAIQQVAYAAARDKLAESPSPPDAVIANLDLSAMGVYQALYEAGLQPGRDVAVVGYDDIWPAQMVHPSLSTVRQPAEEMGREAADVLVDTLEGRIRPGRVVNVTPELVVRDSTALWKRR